MPLQPPEVVSFYITKSLFTNVPIEEVLGVFHGKLVVDESILKRTAFSVD